MGTDLGAEHTLGETGAPGRVSDAPPTYSRKATGLVKVIPILDMMTFNASAASPIGVVLATGMFVVFAAFPGANLTLALIIAAFVLPFIWATYALMSAALPRIGGDYLFGSRILHPIAGLFSNVGTYLGALLSIGLTAYGITTFGLVPAFGAIGAATGSASWVHTANTLSHHGWTFALATIMILALSALSIMGTRVVGRFVTIFYTVALGGLIVGVLVMLFTSHSHFVSAFNTLAKPLTGNPNEYAATIAAGTKAGLSYPSAHGYSAKNTIGALFVVMTYFNATYYGIFLTPEMKRGGQRRRQLIAQAGSGYFQLIFVLLTVVIFFKTAGYNFFLAASNGSLSPKVSASGNFNFFVSIASGSHVLAVLLGVAFVFAIPVWCYGNLGLCYRVPFAYAFDGLLPRRLAAVNARTHTPVVAIAVTGALAILVAAWASFATSFTTVLAYTGMLAYIGFIIVGAAAVVMYRRRPSLYNGSPADWRPGGIRVQPLIGAGCCLAGLGLEVLVMSFHTQVGIKHIAIPILVIVGVFLMAVGLYFGAKAIQRRRGVDLDLVYANVPAE
jgi:amino acid transporter